MNKKFKSLFALLMLAGTNVYANRKLIERSTLGPDLLDPIVLNELLKEKILTPSKLPQFLELNEQKVQELITKSNDPELVEFIDWLKSLAGERTHVNYKKPDEMVLASQDVRGNN